MTIGERIKSYRKEIGMTQAELGARLGVQFSAVSKWERGRVENITLSQAAAMAEIFGISPVTLAGWDDTEKPKKEKVTHLPKRHVIKRSDGMEEICVYDQPAAAGLGNYLDTPSTRLEQYPAGYIPDGTSFGILISGDSMEPRIHDKSTAFVQATPAVSSGEVGIFVLNGEAYCKQILVDVDRREVRLHSFNPKYADIVIKYGDELRTIGRVLGSYPK